MLASNQKTKAKLKRYLIYFAVLMILNIAFGKNITHINYPWYSNVSMFLLLNINIILVILLILLIFRNLAKILSEQKSGLKIKFVVFSIFIAVIPTSVIFTYSSQLMGDNINRWFSRQIDELVNKSAVLVNDFRKNEQTEFVNHTELLARLASDNGLYDNHNTAKFEKMFCSYVYTGVLSDIVLFDKNGDIIAKCSDNSYNEYLEVKLRAAFNELKNDKYVYEFDNIAGGIQWVGILSENEKGGVMALKHTAEILYKDINAINSSFDVYKQNRYFIYPIKNSALLQLLQLSLLVIFVSIWGSLLFARTITYPLEELSKASEKIAQGGLNIQVKEESGGEIGKLINIFNNMARQIQLHTQELNSKNIVLSEMYEQISRDNAYIDTILKNVDSAIIMLSDELQILKSNIKADLFISEYRKEFDDKVLSAASYFKDLSDSEMMINMEISKKDVYKIYLMKFSKIDLSTESQILIVLGDVTDVVDAQKAALWKDIAAKMAHEVKNPLTPIKLMAERVKRRVLKLSDKDSKDMISESMDIIIAESDILKELVEEFNMFARLPKANKSEVNLPELLNDTVSLYKGTYSGISFEIKCDDNIVLNCDRPQLRRVFQNIISNAVYSVDSSSGIISIAVSEINDNIEIRIRDNGSGIEESDIPNLFKPYFSKRQGGTGLGLAIVKKIVEEHSGRISADNHKDGGAVFTITLPRGFNEYIDY